MNKVKLIGDKSSRGAVISLGFMILGIGCFSWAIFNIWAQSNFTQSNLPNHDFKPKTFAIDKSKLKEGLSAKVKSSPLISSVQNKAIYSIYPTEGDNIGNLTIPALKRELPIIQGTNEKDLKQGVGHFIQSVLPGVKDNCVLSGHRDTVFRQIGKLKIGDKLIVQTSAGIFTYEVNKTRIVHKDDKTVIVPTKNAVLTMTTCYPFNFIGDSPDRYIVSATLIKRE